MKKPSLPANELERVAHLRALGILDSSNEVAFDRVVRLASVLTGSPISLISLIDSERQWFKAKVGLDASETPRDISFCGHAILEDQLFEVEDATQDQRFADNPLVTGNPSIRFYAGQPLISTFGYTLGTLCVIDPTRKKLSDEQRKALEDLAGLAVYLIEKRRVDLELDTTRKNFIDLLDRTPMMVVFLDGPEHRFSYVNPAHESFFQDRNLIGKAYTDVRKGEPTVKVKEALDLVYSTGESLTLKERPYLIGNTAKTLDFFFTPSHDVRGRIVGVMVVLHDVTHEKQLRTAATLLSESRRATLTKMNDLFENAPVPICIMEGPEHRFTLANAAYRKLVGRPIVGKTVREAFNSDEVDYYVPLLNQVYSTGEPHTVYEAPLKLEGADEINELYINIDYQPFRSDSGKMLGVMALMHDVTNSVLARKSIERSESDIREIANALPTIVWTALADGTVNWFNERWYEYTGLKGGEGRDESTSAVHPDDLKLVTSRWQDAVTHGKPHSVEFRMQRASDHEYRWFVSRGQPVRDEQGNITRWIGTNTDIHENKTLVKQLEDERELRERFVAALSHDLRTPITAAKMTSQLLARKVDSSLAAQVSRITSNMDRADLMIRDLLDASRIKAGEELAIQLSPCNLNHLVEETVSELSAIHGDRFEIQCPDQAVNLSTDRSLLQRVLENLINNAIKYGSGVDPVTVSITDAGSECILAIRNKGNPIPTDEQATIFEPYKRAEGATLQKGWGIGLTLVKGFTEYLGGRVELTSDSDSGTCFSIHFTKAV
ncbi:MAG: PAS domain-containing protein [Proteobacteria bacterium]|nr:MAG: PAS domain-containing protein [Pseudomonadota bacterium]